MKFEAQRQETVRVFPRSRAACLLSDRNAVHIPIHTKTAPICPIQCSPSTLLFTHDIHTQDRSIIGLTIYASAGYFALPVPEN